MKTKIVEYFNKGFIILGARKENIESIKKDLNDKGLQHIECIGTYKDKKKLASFLVLDNGHNCLRQVGLNIIKTYKQETFLMKPSILEDKYAYLIDNAGKIKKYYREYVINHKMEKYYTQLPDGNCFSFTKESYE
tara:strand:- start:1891 stop:2295 length:405 start_codon:yes stop_codon:yes gene_type:complete